MAGKRDNSEEIVLKLVQVKVLQGQGSSITDAVRQVGVTQPACYRWRIEYGGMRRDQLRCLVTPSNPWRPLPQLQETMSNQGSQTRRGSPTLKGHASLRSVGRSRRTPRRGLVALGEHRCSQAPACPPAGPASNGGWPPRRPRHAWGRRYSSPPPAMFYNGATRRQVQTASRRRDQALHARQVRRRPAPDRSDVK